MKNSVMRATLRAIGRAGDAGVQRRKPDYGRLTHEDVSEHVETVREEIQEFREDLPGV